MLKSEQDRFRGKPRGARKFWPSGVIEAHSVGALSHLALLAKGDEVKIVTKGGDVILSLSQGSQGLFGLLPFSSLLHSM
jgi:hypothetical protein